jgi:hypothetical protein
VLVTHEQDIAAHAKRQVRFLDGRLVSDQATDSLPFKASPKPLPRHQLVGGEGRGEGESLGFLSPLEGEGTPC